MSRILFVLLGFVSVFLEKQGVVVSGYYKFKAANLTNYSDKIIMLIY